MADEQNLQNPPIPTEENTDELIKQRDEYLAGWKRALADYDNLKKETARERMEFKKYAVENMVYELLPVADGFESAIRHFPSMIGVPDETQKAIENWKSGITQIQKMLVTVLEANGVSKITADGKFDPAIHEAAEERDSDELDGTIVEIVSAGYKLHDKLLRPARVAVSKKKINQ
ncbi:MAG: nucleotide exchange factor GrpE [Patescibacteria group bacterium]